MRKKLSIIPIAATVLLMTGCTEEINDKETDSEEIVVVESKEEAKKQSIKVVAAEEVSIANQVEYIRNDEYSGDVFYGYGEVNNNGELPVLVSDVKMDFIDSEGGLLGVSEFNYVLSGVIPPGGKTFYEVEYFAAEDAVDLKQAVTKDTIPNFDTYYGEVVELSTNDIQVKLTADSVELTGYAYNKSETTLEDVEIAVGLYNKDNQLLGVMWGYIDEIRADSKSSFSASNFSLVPIFDQIVTTEPIVRHWSN